MLHMPAHNLSSFVQSHARRQHIVCLQKQSGEEVCYDCCRSCVYVPSAMSRAQQLYSIVISDADDLNAVLNMSTVELVYLDYANVSIASSLVS
jgi:hypothetical protein